MENIDKTKKIELFTFLVSLFTAVSVVTGGLLGYFYRDIWFVEESKKNASLSEVELILKEMEKDVKSLRDELDITSRKASISIDISKFITDLQPNISITFKSFSYVEKDNALKFSYELINHGPRNVIVEKPVAYLSYIHEYPSLTPEKVINQNSYRVDAVEPGVIPPSHKPEIYTVDIFLDKKITKKKIYSTVLFKVRTHPVVRKIAESLLGDLITGEEVEQLTERHFFRHSTNSF